MNEKRNSKRQKSLSSKMPVTDFNDMQNLDDGILFPIEEIAQYPLPGYISPTSISFSPDDTLVSFLFSPDNTLNRKLFAFDRKTNTQELLFSPPNGGLDESNISPEEKLRRERLRERGLGVTRYEWLKTNSKRKAVMVPLPAGIYVQDVSHSKAELKLPSILGSPIIDPHLSPDGSMLAYVRDYELHVMNLLSNESKQLTHGAQENGFIHGLAEYIAQEEMDRKTGYWWSLDSKYIAFTEVDSSEIPLFRIMHQGKSSVGSDAQEDHPYPFAGASNVKVRLGVVSVAGGSITWMDLLCGGSKHSSEEEYLARVNWMHGNTLTAQILNRHQTKIKILKFDIRTGQRKEILVEENSSWINLHDCFTPLDKGVTKFSAGFIWASEKTGFRHLYLHDANGTCLGPITEGEWMVEQITGVNEATGVVYFTGTLDSPVESNLYCAKLFVDGTQPLQPPTRLTHGKGKHVVVLDHHMQSFVDIHDSLGSPPTVLLCSLEDGSIIMPLYEQQPSTIPRFKKLRLEPPEIIEIKANDGTVLYGALYKPDASRFGPPPYRTMINVYGGPSVQLVSNSWINTVDLRTQFLRNQGILVWKLDNRGTARRGLKFESSTKHKLGQIDADDQLTGAEWLVKQGLAKAGHIGLYGWSYGGYLSAMTLSRYSDFFKCAIAGAPVTSWDGYDTFYTEKYMGLPSENRSGYENGSVMNQVHKLKGRLLLVHGMIDENVHFRHTARLINALVTAGKPYELIIFPDERHMPRRHSDRVYMEERMWEFINRNL